MIGEKGLRDDAGKAAGEGLGLVGVSVVDYDVKMPWFGVSRGESGSGGGVPEREGDDLADVVGVLCGGLFAIVPVGEDA